MSEKPHQASHKATDFPFCPCCGRPNAIRLSPEWLLTHFSGIFGNMLALLIERRRAHKSTSVRDMCVAGYNTELFPVHAKDSLFSLIHQNRGKLNRMGWEIAGPKVTGDGFYLVPLDYDR